MPYTTPVVYGEPPSTDRGHGRGGALMSGPESEGPGPYVCPVLSHVCGPKDRLRLSGRAGSRTPESWGAEGDLGWEWEGVHRSGSTSDVLGPRR